MLRTDPIDESRRKKREEELVVTHELESLTLAGNRPLDNVDSGSIVTIEVEVGCGEIRERVAEIADDAHRF